MLTNNALTVYSQPIQSKRIKLELLDFNLAVLDTIEGVCVGGSLQKVADEPLRRSGDIVLAVPINPSATTFLDAVSGYTISYGGKIWLDKYVKIYIGIDNLNALAPTEWQTFGICLIDEPKRDFSAEQYQITFSVIDMMARFTGLRFGHLTALSTVIEANVQSGSTYTPTETAAALAAVITELGSVSKYSIYPLPQKYKYLPYDIKVDVGATVWDLLSQFMDILSGWQIYFDDDGVLRVEPIPSGAYGITYPLKPENIISAQVETDFQVVKNQIVVYGRTIEPSFTTTTATYPSPISISYSEADVTEFTIGATVLAFRFTDPSAYIPQTNSFSLTTSNGTMTCNLIDYSNITPYVPRTQIMQGYYYCIRLYSATLDANGKVDPTYAMTWEWLGKQQISACRVDDNRESPFYINNQIPNSYWCGLCSPVPAFAYTLYEMHIDDNADPINALPDGTILTFMVTNTNLADQTIQVFSSSGTSILGSTPIYDNGSPITFAKMVGDYTIFMVQYDATNSRFNFLGRHPYVLTKVLSGGVYDNIFADTLADERAQYELFLASSMQNNINLSIVPNFSLDANVKIPFSDNWAMPYDVAQATEEIDKTYIIKSITYPLGVGDAPQEIQAIEIYTDDNLVGNDYEIPTTQAPQLEAPTISVSGVTLTISGASGAMEFEVSALSTGSPDVTFTTTERSVNLSFYLQDDVNYVVSVIAKGRGYKDSAASNSVGFSFVQSYIAFVSPQTFTLSTYNGEKNWNGTLEYSTDATNWSVWNGSDTLNSSSGDVCALCVRGLNNNRITGSSSGLQWVLTGTAISCKGNIENLLDYQTVLQSNHPIMASQCFRRLFWNCAALTSAPKLPATALSRSCYEFMFYKCTSLTTAPELPATSLDYSCYEGMFYGCTSLITAPALPATVLANNCYNSMFYGCTSLTTAPALPATTLADGCYLGMFGYCSSLTSAPELPATSLAITCYAQMFVWCTSLTSAPELPATTLEIGCYLQMFAGCTSLTTAPALSATTLASSCYYGMFRSCTSIKVSATQTGNYTKPYRIPTTGTGTTASNALTDMFTNTGGTFTGTPTINTTYYLWED